VIAQEAPPVPESLVGRAVPEPSNLGDFVRDKAAAIRLGKALFWDMQVGSDNETACASCHFHGGADNRDRNQVSPGLLRRASIDQTNPDTTFQLAGPNATLTLANFPLHRLHDPRNRNSAVLSTTNDTVTSQGVFNEVFRSIGGQVTGLLPNYPLLGDLTPLLKDPYEGFWTSHPADNRTVLADPVFHVSGINTRRVEPRNSPTVINAVFNRRNFWDGRAQSIFNGVNPHGLRDTNARVFKNVPSGLNWTIQPVSVAISNASLASQASGPPLSDFEMSAAGRGFPELGKKMLYRRPLAGQKVHLSDSVLGWYRHISGVGLSKSTYAEMVRDAFRSEWWNGTKLIRFNADGSRTLTPITYTQGANECTQMQANFSLFFGLAVQLYEATLVSDQTPFDRFVRGDANAMTPRQAAGMGLFFGKGKCAACHGGPALTTASVFHPPIARMVMGNGAVALYDEGYYNIGVTPTLQDIAVGGKDPFGNPLSFSALARQGAARFQQLNGSALNLGDITASERIAVNGSFKTPGLRNVELTAPFFHNGDSATLRQVVEFYNRGGNFFDQNLADIDADIQPLGLTESEIDDLVDFMKALTDDRVRFDMAPFDHPQLLVPNGHVGNTTVVTNDGAGRAVDVMVEIPETGSGGVSDNRFVTRENFLGTEWSGSRYYRVIARHSGKCVDVLNRATGNGAALIQWPCASPALTQVNQRFQLVADEKGSMRLYAQHSGRVVEVSGGSQSDGAKVQQWDALSGLEYQRWRIVRRDGNYHTIVNQQSRKCLTISGASTADFAPVVLGTCNGAAHQDFVLEELPVLMLEADIAMLSGATLQTARAGWTYAGYATITYATDKVTFTLRAPSAGGNYGVNLRYATATTGTRQIRVSANGGTATIATVPGTTSWALASAGVLALKPGVNTIVIQGHTGSLDLDHVSLVKQP
jgi:cytochrome c peroxidase